MSRLPRVLLRLACLGVALGLVGAGAARWHRVSQPDYRLRRGQEALRQGDLAAAEQVADRLEAGGYPDHAHLLRGEGFLRQQRLAETVRELNQIREEAEAVRLEAGVVFGLGFLSLGRPREAEQLLLYVVAKNPDAVEARRGLASLYFDQGAKALAVYHVREWLRVAPEDGYAWRFLGILYSDFGDSNNWAIDALRQALRCGLREPIATAVKKELAQLLVKQTKFEEALVVLAEFDPDQAEAQEVEEARADSLRGLGRRSELRVLLDRVLPRFPRSVNLLSTRGQVFLDDDDPTAATALLERAVELDRHDVGSRHLLAQAYESLGRKAEAAEQRRRLLQDQAYLEQISDLSTQAIDKPWDAALRYRLAEVCEKLDLYSEAAMWRKAAGFCPPGPEEAGRAAPPERAGAKSDGDSRRSP